MDALAPGFWGWLRNKYQIFVRNKVCGKNIEEIEDHIVSIYGTLIDYEKKFTQVSKDIDDKNLALTTQFNKVLEDLEYLTKRVEDQSNPNTVKNIRREINALASKIASLEGVVNTSEDRVDFNEDDMYSNFQIWNQCKRKRKYRTERLAKEAASIVTSHCECEGNDKVFTQYYCDICGGWHLTKKK